MANLQSIGMTLIPLVIAENSENVNTDTAATVSTTAALQSSDVNDDLNPTACWVAVYVPGGSNNHAFHYNIGGTNTYPIFSLAII
jgi:hypothetical protein